ncbi:aldo/keto reductase [Actinoplanes sp. RD1]|uniref:aldo/keto reductase n=1 Tax=Actinoplanes sp. RD1 TaxID=3064538 RepID=UPI0027423B13|nr:aldo/keto reductase [Actinoplanes sp. RD1]
MELRRTLGRSGIEVSALGMGGWAIGGPFWAGEQPLGWGEVDDAESARAVHRAVDLGVTYFDTADVYGAGHGERVLGAALAHRRDQVVISTKWGNTFDEASRKMGDEDGTPEHLGRAVRDSLRRLGTDRIDLYLLHLNDLPVPRALELVPVLEQLVTEGLIRSYGWSTDFPERARAFAEAGKHCTAIQFDFSVLRGAGEILDVCESFDLAAINRGPLAMGLLTGKYDGSSRLADDDIRGLTPEWMTFFQDGKPVPEWLDRVAAVREVLTSGGRTLAQGALGWLWARSPRNVPIPGFRTVAQVEENAAALRTGPLTPEELATVEKLLGRA